MILIKGVKNFYLMENEEYSEKIIDKIKNF